MTSFIVGHVHSYVIFMKCNPFHLLLPADSPSKAHRGCSLIWSDSPYTLTHTLQRRLGLRSMLLSKTLEPGSCYWSIKVILQFKLLFQGLLFFFFLLQLQGWAVIDWMWFKRKRSKHTFNCASPSSSAETACSVVCEYANCYVPYLGHVTKLRWRRPWGAGQSHGEVTGPCCVHCKASKPLFPKCKSIMFSCFQCFPPHWPPASLDIQAPMTIIVKT